MTLPRDRDPRLTTIRPGKMIHALAENQTADVMTLVEKVISGMKKAGIDQWDEVYPDLGRIQTDLHQKSAYGYFSDEHLVGYVAVDGKAAPEYGLVDWRIPAKRYLVVHRLCVDPQFQGKGIGRQLLGFSEAYAREHGYESIRLDAFSQNPRSLGLYEDHGYRRAGEIRLRKGLFFCYEKGAGLPQAFTYFDHVTDDFVTLTDTFDKELKDKYGALQDQYSPFNKLDHIHDILVGTVDGVPAACGAIKLYGEGTYELKRIFVRREYRNLGLGRQIVQRLEAEARRKGAHTLILETGKQEAPAIALYKAAGFVERNRYGQYETMEESLCMEKNLEPG